VVYRTLLAALFVLTAAVPATLSGQPAQALPRAARSVDSPPVFAYYYIWFDPSSWDRAKTDLPTLGKYSSDDEDVMRQQIVWAKQAGIDGFIVSWKHTPTLDRRLSRLIDVAQAENFSLEIIYQGLDFSRKPLPVLRVADDLEYFVQTFAARTPFHYFSKPLVIWSGTWMYSAADIESVSRPIRHDLLVLASEKNVDGYERLAGSVDGEAYYWSSVNPDTNHGYLEKLTDMSNAVHRDGGLWIAPAASGFDARAIGGTTIVDRQNGAVFEHELTTANASAPDAIGVISWNEFSENSQIEPSQKYGFRYLQVLASTLGREPSFPVGAGVGDSTDSSSPGGGSGYAAGLIVAPIIAALSLLAALVVFRRSRPPRPRRHPRRDPHRDPFREPRRVPRRLTRRTTRPRTGSA
jgi:glycosyl hydrolase family 99